MRCPGRLLPLYELRLIPRVSTPERKCIGGPE